MNDNKNKLPIVLFIAAVVWFIVSHILMWTLGMKLAPSGGIDAIGSALLYVLLWRIIVWVPPLIFIILSLLILLHRKYPKFFVICVIVPAVIVVMLVIYNTVIKRVIYTPSYLARHTKSYKEYCEQDLNEFERTKETVQDHINDYIYWQSEHILEKVNKWANTPDKQKAYVEAFLNYRIHELPDVTDYKYISDVLSVLDSNFEGDSVRLSSDKINDLLVYTGAAAWCDKHYGYGSPIVDIDNPTVILYYNDNTIDAIDIYLIN